jgi:hypothetical protein
MGLLVLLWLLSLPALIVLAVWIVRLAARPAARAEARRRWLRTLLGVGLLVPASLPCVLITAMVWQARAERAALHVATHHRLDAPARIGGIDLPAGTQLELGRADDRDSFVYADFPDGHTVFGVRTRRIFRNVNTRSGPDRSGTSVSIAAEADTWVDGWHCGATPGSLLQALTMTLPADGSPARLTACRAADGNRVDGHALPAESEITAVADRQDPAGRWDIVLPRQAFFPVRGVPVYLARFRVDDAHRVTTLTSAELACRLTLGPITYAPGTEVSGREEASVPDAWVFQTGAGRVATRDGVPIEAGARLVQSPDGRLHRIVPAREAPGPFARFVVPDEPVPGPASPELPCDEMMWSWPATTTPSPAPSTR